MRKFILILSLCFLFVTAYSINSLFALADDDEYEERMEEYDHEDENDHYDEERYEHEEEERHKYEMEDEHDEEFGREDKRNQNAQQKPIVIKQEYWYKWSRSADIPEKYAETPISSEKTVPIQFQEKEPLYTNVIPMKGQLFVPLEETAQYLGASVILYPASKIAEIQLNDKLLIVKNGSRAVYENMKKTPMPHPIFEKNEKLYIPISVLANGLGFQVTWKNQKIFVYE